MMRFEIRGRVIDRFTGDGIGGQRAEARDKDRRPNDQPGLAITSAA